MHLSFDLMVLSFLPSAYILIYTYCFPILPQVVWMLRVDSVCTIQVLLDVVPELGKCTCGDFYLQPNVYF